MKKTIELYQAKIINDGGLVRSRVPVPLLKTMGARPGDHVVFHRNGSTATMQILRAKKNKNRSKKS